MDIETAKEKKDQLEKSIYSLVQKWMDETGLIVESITIKSIMHKCGLNENDRCYIIDVCSDIKNPLNNEGWTPPWR